ncbi:MAG: glycosyltransferase [Helicobacteraceae bacterium]|jgi:glycosyltransferase involved in cell wall biosynthesis|nr:glycosyltransferase [Helicobacteraceae bacterium]
MRLTIVITNHNRPKIILSVLDSIFDQNLRDVAINVLIIDDCSSDPIDPKDLEKYGDRVKIRRLEQNIGVNAARNVGAKLATGDFLILADDDDLFIAGSLQKAFDAIFSLENWRKYGAFGFMRTNAMDIPFDDFFFWDEATFIKYRENYLSIGGDFVYIIQTKFGRPTFMESEITRTIGAESYGVIRNFVKYHDPSLPCPIWKIAVTTPTDADNTTNRLTNPDNALLKAEAFAKWQQAEIEEMEETGFDRKMPKYYRRRIKGLFTYLLLDNRRREALNVLRKKPLGIVAKSSLFLLAIFPPKVIHWLLKRYRGFVALPLVKRLRVAIAARA